MASREKQRETATEKGEEKKHDWLTSLCIHSSLQVSLGTCIHTHVCIIRQEVTKWEKQSRGDSDLKIDYRWTDYHNKGWGKVVK